MAGCRVCPGSDAGRWLYEYHVAREHPTLGGCVSSRLEDTGFVEGQNVAVEYRWANGEYERLPELVADLVRRHVTVLAATGGDPSPQVAMAATQTIPIVFTANGDPVRNGLVASLNRPGGNVPASRYSARLWSPSACSCCESSCRGLPPSHIL